MVKIKEIHLQFYIIQLEFLFSACEITFKFTHFVMLQLKTIF